MQQPKLSELQSQVDAFNQRYAIGDTVTLKLDSGETKDVKVRYIAEVLGGHSAVGWFAGISGCYLLDRVLHDNQPD